MSVPKPKTASPVAVRPPLVAAVAKRVNRRRLIYFGNDQYELSPANTRLVDSDADCIKKSANRSASSATRSSRHHRIQPEPVGKNGAGGEASAPGRWAFRKTT